MDSIINNLTYALKNNAFEFGVAGIILSHLLLVGLIYLFINRNQVMTLIYGLVLAGMVLFTFISILTLLSVSLWRVFG